MRKKTPVRLVPLSKSDKVILFFGQHDYPAYWKLSNFFPCKFHVNGEWVKSVEHYYQAQKYIHNQEHYDEVMNASTPAHAKKIGRKYEIRDNWDGVKYGIMVDAIYAKFSQVQECRTVLLNTKNYPIHEDSPFDYVWGWRNNGDDLLGEILMNTRTTIRIELGLK